MKISGAYQQWRAPATSNKPLEGSGVGHHELKGGHYGKEAGHHASKLVTMKKIGAHHQWRAPTTSHNVF